LLLMAKMNHMNEMSVFLSCFSSTFINGQANQLKVRATHSYLTHFYKQIDNSESVCHACPFSHQMSTFYLSHKNILQIALAHNKRNGKMNKALGGQKKTFFKLLEN